MKIQEKFNPKSILKNSVLYFKADDIYRILKSLRDECVGEEDRPKYPSEVLYANGYNKKREKIKEIFEKYI